MFGIGQLFAALFSRIIIPYLAVFLILSIAANVGMGYYIADLYKRTARAEATARTHNDVVKQMAQEAFDADRSCQEKIHEIVNYYKGVPKKPGKGVSYLPAMPGDSDGVRPLDSKAPRTNGVPGQKDWPIGTNSSMGTD